MLACKTGGKDNLRDVGHAGLVKEHGVKGLSVNGGIDGCLCDGGRDTAGILNKLLLGFPEMIPDLSKALIDVDKSCRFAARSFLLCEERLIFVLVIGIVQQNTLIGCQASLCGVRKQNFAADISVTHHLTGRKIRHALCDPVQCFVNSNIAVGDNQHTKPMVQISRCDFGKGCGLSGSGRTPDEGDRLTFCVKKCGVLTAGNGPQGVDAFAVRNCKLLCKVRLCKIDFTEPVDKCLQQMPGIRRVFDRSQVIKFCRGRKLKRIVINGKDGAVNSGRSLLTDMDAGTDGKVQFTVHIEGIDKRFVLPDQFSVDGTVHGPACLLQIFDFTVQRSSIRSGKDSGFGRGLCTGGRCRS